VRKKLILLTLALLTSRIGISYAEDVVIPEQSESSTEEEKKETFELEPIFVEAVEVDKKQDQFGNTITEQSYYRTGGDVDVIDREEIEKKHYLNITDAVKRIPGVQVASTGYHGGEYGYAFNSQVSINGDDRVIILVDGRRVDNAASSFAGSGSGNSLKSLVSLNTVTNIANVEKIEVIKGPGASIYGSDATGGVINIITRKGDTKPLTTIDLATGSWGKHNYSMTHSGAAQKGSLKYFVSLNREMSGDTKYKDGVMDKSYRFKGTKYKENGTSVRIDKDFSKDRNLQFSFNYTDSRSNYPITAPDYRTYDRLWNGELYADYLGGKGSAASGYRNWFWLDAALGSYNATRGKDFNLKYTFKKSGEMENFVRVFHDDKRYWGKDYSGLFGKSPSDLNNPQKWADEMGKKKETVHEEESKGLQAQFAKVHGRHDVLSTWTYQQSKYTYTNPQTGKNRKLERDTFSGFIQDKIHITKKWDITPAIRFEKYSDFERVDENGVVSYPKQDAASKVITLIGQTQYAFSDTASIYLSWAQVYRPLRNNDYDQTFEELDDEKGNSWTIGAKKEFSKKTSVSVNYGLTDMSNAIARYSVFNPKTMTWENRAVNSTQKKEALNLGLHHQFNDSWSAGLSYSYVFDRHDAKNYQTNSLDKDMSINALINRLRPLNTYQIDVNFSKKKWDVNLSAQIFSGMSERYFTDSRFVVLGLGANYRVNDKLLTYVNIENLTDTAYENRAHSVYGLGAYPQPGRNFLFGMKYSF
jgi:outer membrane receptor protein involved in Fe transport